MKCSYIDILNSIPHSPLWWDERGVPRYTQFNPSLSANPYANEVALMLIECQACSYCFRVCLSSDLFDFVQNESRSLTDLHPHLYYGDPPNKPCCKSGPTIGSISKQVIEFWIKEKDPDTKRVSFIRKPQYEMELIDDDP
jgi:hypothetical protein